MTQEHPITPPPELVEEWIQDHATKYDLARHAAQWGADSELDACCDFIKNSATNFSASAHLYAHRQSDQLRAARRPKPPSLRDRLIVALQNEDIGTALRLARQLDD